MMMMMMIDDRFYIVLETAPKVRFAHRRKEAIHRQIRARREDRAGRRLANLKPLYVHVRKRMPFLSIAPYVCPEPVSVK